MPHRFRARLRAVSIICAVAGAAATAAATAAAAATPLAADASSARPSAPDSRGVDTTIAAGVHEWSESFQIAAGPEQARVMTVDLTRGSVRLGVVEAHDLLIYPHDERTTSMAARTGALAGVNGDYFAMGGNGAPLGGFIRDQQIWKTANPGFPANLIIDSDGRAHIGELTFTGTVHAGRSGGTRPLASINVVNDAINGNVTEVTHVLGTTYLSRSLSWATYVTGRYARSGFVVQHVYRRAHVVRRLPANHYGLLGTGPGGKWLSMHVRKGMRIRLDRTLSDPHVSQLISGATVIVRSGAVYRTVNGTPPSGRNPETMVGVSRDGGHVILAVIDGRSRTSVGVTPMEAGAFMAAHGAWTAMLLDGGGSTVMTARTRGALQILNHPSDYRGERRVANGLFVYRR